MLLIYYWDIPSAVALTWISWDFINAKSTLVQVMAWSRRQATTHYLNQCWPSSMLPYVVIGHDKLNIVISLNLKFHEVFSYLLTTLFLFTLSFLSALKRYLLLLWQIRVLPLFIHVLWSKLTVVNGHSKRQFADKYSAKVRCNRLLH